MGAPDLERLMALIRELDERCAWARAVRQELTTRRARASFWPDRRRAERAFEGLPAPDTSTDPGTSVDEAAD